MLENLLLLITRAKKRLSRKIYCKIIKSRGKKLWLFFPGFDLEFLLVMYCRKITKQQNMEKNEQAEKQIFNQLFSYIFNASGMNGRKFNITLNFLLIFVLLLGRDDGLGVEDNWPGSRKTPLIEIIKKLHLQNSSLTFALQSAKIFKIIIIFPCHFDYK
jgi:hypothetical protein